MYIIAKQRKATYYFYLCASYRENGKVKRIDKYICNLTTEQIKQHLYDYVINSEEQDVINLLEKKLEAMRVAWDVKKYFPWTFGKLKRINVV